MSRGIYETSPIKYETFVLPFDAIRLIMFAIETNFPGRVVALMMFDISSFNERTSSILESKCVCGSKRYQLTAIIGTNFFVIALLEGGEKCRDVYVVPISSRMHGSVGLEERRTPYQIAAQPSNV